MKNGMEMMLDSMGVQTDEIKKLLNPNNIKQLLQKVETLCNDAEQIKTSCLRIETKLGTLPETVAMQLLENGSSEAFKDATDFVRDYNDGDSRNSDNGNGAGSVNPGNAGDDTGRDSGSGRGL